MKNKLFKRKKPMTLHHNHKNLKFKFFNSPKRKVKKLLDSVSILKKSTKCTLTEDKEANKSSFLKSRKRQKYKKLKDLPSFA
jgi:hypothetical protein